MYRLDEIHSVTYSQQYDRLKIVGMIERRSRWSCKNRTTTAYRQWSHSLTHL